MSNFINAFDAFVNSSASAPALRGENGTLEYSASQVGDYLVAFFFALVRDLPDERLHQLFMDCVTSAKLQPRVTTEVMADLFVLTFQTRDCRGGKGERALFYKLFLELCKHFPETCQRALSLIAEYGSFRDYFQLLALVGVKDSEEMGDKDDERNALLRNAIIKLLVEQLKKDDANLTSGTPGLSLCAKYCPREGTSFAKAHKATFTDFLAALFPECAANQREVTYRKFITRITAALDVCEVKMCAKQFSAIDFTKIPSLCMQKYRKAFLNEKLKEPPASTGPENETGNRFPDDADRVQARKNLRDIVLNKATSIKGGQLFPHELSSKFMHGHRSPMSTLEKDIIQAQWVDLRTKLVQKLEERRAAETESEGKASAVDFGKLLPLVDVSGSMSGTPMEVAIALGILISEINHEAFRGRLITFDSDPSWVKLEGLTTLEEKVHVTQSAPWGMNTDLEKAFALIEEVVVRNNLSEKEVPDLIIFSDMQFDQAVGSQYLTQFQRIDQRFHNIGMKIAGKPYARPRIVFWNLRGNTGGFPATASTPNVQMLSGYSPSLFNALVNGEAIAAAADPENPDEQPTVTPYDTMRSILDDARYHAVREILSASSEGSLAKYHFERPVEVEADPDSMDVDADTASQPAKRQKMGGVVGGRGRGRGGRGGRRGRR